MTLLVVSALLCGACVGHFPGDPIALRDPSTADATPVLDATRDAVSTPDAPRVDVNVTVDGGTRTDAAARSDTPGMVTPPAGTTVMAALPMLTARQVPTIAAAAGVRAFPGAEGFGAVATGGRGGRVIYVTTLNPSGPGSLAAALEATGPRYVLFKVSGVINASVRIAKGDVTIAGHTSPGGIVVRGLFTDEDNFCDSSCGAGVRGVDNIVVRHLRSRPGTPASGDGNIDGDGVRIRHSRRVVLDHVSTENAVDEALEISYSNNVTVQDCVLGETLGDHAERGGLLMNYSNPAAGYELDALSVIRTTWVRIEGRYPEMSRESPAAANSTARIELANNLLWDQRYYIDSGHTNGVSGAGGSPVYYQLNWVGNVGVALPSYPYGMLFFPNPTGRSRAFMRDNRLNVAPSRTDWQLVYCCNDFRDFTPDANPPAWVMTARMTFPSVNYLPSSQVRAYALAHAGAFPRDPMDRRLLGYVAAGVIPNADPAGNPANDARRNDWSPAAAPTAPVDTDSDGMPDVWERAHGLNPAVQDHNGLTVGMTTPALMGYTNLEVYLAELAEQRLVEGPWG